MIRRGVSSSSSINNSIELKETKKNINGVTYFNNGNNSNNVIKSCWLGSIVCFVLAVVYLQYVSFWIQSCSGSTSTSGSASRFRFLIIGDSHLLGNRRSKIDRLWVDWQVRRSVEFAISKHNPTDLIFLGDLFDEGIMKNERHRFLREISIPASKAGIRLHMIAGNHDVGEHYQLRKSTIDMFENEIGHGVNSYRENVCEQDQCVSILGVNTMALEGTPFDREVNRNTLSFLSKIQSMREDGRNKLPLILLTHLPLFRDDDTNCGFERSGETGHVTYAHPSTKLIPKRDVLSKSTSRMLLESFRPSLVLSAHTHAVCRRYHDDLRILELTTSAFGWRMRPDPAYLFVEFENDPSSLSSSLYCRLPHERISMAISWTLSGISLVLALVSIVLLVSNHICFLGCFRASGKEHTSTSNSNSKKL